MQPGFRTLARARRPDALETLFADETAVAPPRPDAPQAPRPIDVVAPRPIDDLDLQLFAEEHVSPPRPSRRVSWPTISGSSPYVVALLVALFTVASPMLLSQQTEPERSDPLTVVAQQASDVAPSIPDLPVATTSEAIVEPSAPPPSAPSAAPAARSSTSRPPAKPAAEKPVATKPVATKPATPPPVSRTLSRATHEHADEVAGIRAGAAAAAGGRDTGLTAGNEVGGNAGHAARLARGAAGSPSSRRRCAASGNCTGGD